MHSSAVHKRIKESASTWLANAIADAEIGLSPDFTVLTDVQLSRLFNDVKSEFQVPLEIWSRRILNAEQGHLPEEFLKCSLVSILWIVYDWTVWLMLCLSRLDHFLIIIFSRLLFFIYDNSL